MFSGIISDVGRIVAIDESTDLRDWRITIACRLRAEQCELGASIACNGVCLTIAGRELAERQNEGQNEGQKENLRFTLQAGKTTRERTTVASWRAGGRVNLEPSLRLGDSLDGHLVMGHVDVRVRLTKREERENELLLHFALAEETLPADENLANMIVARGSVALDGVSLTVASCEREDNRVADNMVTGFSFAVAIIPYTAQHTTLGKLKAGDWANIEIDMLARYVAARTNLYKTS